MRIIFNNISEEEFRENLRLKLVEYVRKNNYQICEAAIQIKVDVKTISRLLKGKNIPSITTIRKIVKVLDVSYDELFDFEYKELNK